MNKKFLILVFIATIGIILIILFYQGEHRYQIINNKIIVATSFYPLYFLAKEIGGVQAEIINITPAGAEPHDYELTGQDLVRIQKSRLLILNGGHLEPWGDKIAQELKNTIIVIASQNLTVQQTIDEDGKIIIDPHVWLDPILAKKEAEKITQGFITADPENKAYYKTNLEKLAYKLEQLHQSYSRGLQACRQKSFITSHAAFYYLAKEYHLNEIAILGISPDEEPSAKKMAEITELIKKNNIKIIFFENLRPTKLSETIASESGVKTLVLNPLESLSDVELNQEKNYFTEMEKNLKNLRLALQCE